MSSRFDLIAQQLIQKKFSDCTLEDLQQLTEQYPYLAPAHFLLAKKLQQEGESTSSAPLQKAPLYYHQPSGFAAFLNFEEFIEEAFMSDETDEETAEEEDLPLLNISSLETAKADIPVAEAFAPEPAPMQVVEEQPLELVGTLQPPQNPEPDIPAFEPFHTVDYFASQGIRLSAEEATKDKFGKQLKSFTQWLKTMKRLPASEQIKNLDPHSEQKVEHLAAHSVEDAEIVTETMAEVWIKQGSWEKAAQVYQKLVLLHPSKKAYFAHKLESLKNKL